MPWRSTGGGDDGQGSSVKYLSSSRLMALQLRDVTFRRHFLLQCLILMQASEVPAEGAAGAAARRAQPARPRRSRAEAWATAHASIAGAERLRRAPLVGLVRCEARLLMRPWVPNPHPPARATCPLGALQWCERPRQKDKNGLRAKLLDDLQARRHSRLHRCFPMSRAEWDRPLVPQAGLPGAGGSGRLPHLPRCVPYIILGYMSGHRLRASHPTRSAHKLPHLCRARCAAGSCMVAAAAWGVIPAVGTSSVRKMREPCLRNEGVRWVAGVLLHGRRPAGGLPCRNPALPEQRRLCLGPQAPQDLRSRVYAELEATPDRGKEFAAAIRHLMQVSRRRGVATPLAPPARTRVC